MLEIQGLIGSTASAMAVIAGVLSLADRWVSHRDPPAPAAPLASPSGLTTSPSGLILLPRPRPAPPRRHAATRLRQAARLALVPMAWFVSFVAGSIIFTLSVALLAPLIPRLAQAAAATDLANSLLAPADVLRLLIMTNFVSIFLVTTGRWQRRGALIAVALGCLAPSGDLWRWLLTR